MFDSIDFDFENNDYLYHETYIDNAIDILSDGLYVTGVNIIDAKNVIETTTLPLPYEDKEELEEFFASERSESKLRTVNAVVILACPKGEINNLAEVYDGKHNGEYFSHLVPPEHVLGYCDLERMEFYQNPYYEGYEPQIFRM